MLIELTEEQVEEISGGDTYFDMGYAIGKAANAIGPYAFGATSYAMYAAVKYATS